MIQAVKGVLTAGAVVAVGLGLRWVTGGSVEAATTEDLASMAGVAVGAVGWVAYCWLVVAILATALERAPGAIGRSASVIAGWITSQSSRALLRSALGLAAVSPLTIAVAHAAPGDSGPQYSVAQGQAQGQGRWADVEPRSVVQLTGITVDVRRPVEQRRPTVGPAQRLGVPDRPTDGAPTRYTDLGSGRELRPVQPTRSPRHHVVRRGDSLWAIAAAELGPGAPDAAVAARWPQWYAANNAVIGPDPELLLPGQVLRAPSHPPSQLSSQVSSQLPSQLSRHSPGQVPSHSPQPRPQP